MDLGQKLSGQLDTNFFREIEHGFTTLQKLQRPQIGQILTGSRTIEARAMQSNTVKFANNWFVATQFLTQILQ